MGEDFNIEKIRNAILFLLSGVGASLLQSLYGSAFLQLFKQFLFIVGLFSGILFGILIGYHISESGSIGYEIKSLITIENFYIFINLVIKFMVWIVIGYAATYITIAIFAENLGLSFGIAIGLNFLLLGSIGLGIFLLNYLWSKWELDDKVSLSFLYKLIT